MMKKDPLIGEWRSLDAHGSDVVYQVTKKKSGYSVVAYDSFDGEVADVFEQKWNARTNIFSFATHWNSTGRFSRCHLQVLAPDQVELTYTFTDTELLVRSSD